MPLVDAGLYDSVIGIIFDAKILFALAAGTKNKPHRSRTSSLVKSIEHLLVAVARDMRRPSRYLRSTTVIELAVQIIAGRKG
jgi:hypothetical protein